MSVRDRTRHWPLGLSTVIDRRSGHRDSGAAFEPRSSACPFPRDGRFAAIPAGLKKIYFEAPRQNCRFSAAFSVAQGMASTSKTREQ